jgi:hypothetical protein
MESGDGEAGGQSTNLPGEVTPAEICIMSNRNNNKKLRYQVLI